MDRIEFGKRLIRESSAAQRMNAAMDKKIESAGEKALRDTQKPDKPKKPDAKTVAFKQRVAKKIASMSPEQRSQVKNKEKAQTSSAIVKRDPDKGGALAKRDNTKVDKTDKIKQKLKIRMTGAKKQLRSGLRSTSKAIARSKLKSPSLTQISSDDKGATAMQKGAGNVVKTAATTASNVAKVGAKAARHGVRALNYLRKNVKVTREEFIQEIEEKEDKKKKDKLDKIIDVMRGKNKVTINPDVKEEVKTENWKDDYVATEYETVDIIKPEPLNASDWRKELDSLRP